MPNTLVSLTVGAILLASIPAGLMAEGRYFPDTAVSDWQGQRFTIQRVEFLDEDSLERQSLESWMDGDNGEIAGLQGAIRSNPALSSALRARSVQINNVVAISRALNGNLVVYLR